ncbi:MAG: hypothetical protein U0Q12_04275 [Vicinamibacterales bacterium]
MPRYIDRSTTIGALLLMTAETSVAASRASSLSTHTLKRLCAGTL